MNPIEQMRTSIAERHTEARTKERAEIERDHRRQEQKAAKVLTARLQPQEGFDMPPLPERPAELIELEARRAQLRRDRQEIESELRPIEDALSREQEQDIDPLDQAAERIAAGATEVTAPDALPEQIETLRARLDLAQRAERLVTVRVAEARASHNRAIAKALRPQHRVAVQRIHAALLEVEAANSEELAVRNAIPGAPLDSFSFPNLGTRGPGGGPLNYWISYARRFGMLDEEDGERTISEAAD